MNTKSSDGDLVAFYAMPGILREPIRKIEGIYT